MTLYHGSSQIVREPRIIQPKRTLDYGAGFYTTTSEKQELIAELKTYKLIDQMVFHTEESLRVLRFIEVKEVK